MIYGAPPPEEVDWRLSRSAGDSGLNRYESTLLDLVFRGSAEVAVSRLKGTLRPTLAAADMQLQQDAAAAGWFGTNRGAKVGTWVGAGVFAVLAGLVVLAVAGSNFGAGWVGVAISFVGLVWIATCGVMVRRPRRELELRRRAAAFQAYIRDLDEHLEVLADKPELIRAYLPYAVALGAEQRWARAFQVAAASSSMPPWYMSGIGGNQFWLFPTALYQSVSYVPPGTSGGTSSDSSSGGGFSSGDSGFSGSSGDGGGSSGGGSW